MYYECEEPMDIKDSNSTESNVTDGDLNIGYCNTASVRNTKFMQVEVDEMCMCTNFGWRSLSGFGDIATFKNGQISLSDHGL